MDSVLANLLRPVAGPESEQMAAGRRMLLMRLAQERLRPGPRRRFFLRPAGILAGGLAFGALAVGAAASMGVDLDRNVADLLTELSVPGFVQDNVEGLPRRDLPENVPSAVPSPSGGIQSPGEQLPIVAQQGEGGAHGEAVSTAVADAIASSEPGSGRGAAVGQAACENGKDRATLPGPAQAHGPPAGNQSQECPDDTPGNSDGAGGPPTTTGQGQPENPGPPESPGQGSPPVQPGPPADSGPPESPGQGNPPVDSGPPSDPGPPDAPGGTTPPVEPGPPSDPGPPPNPGQGNGNSGQ